MSKPAGVEIGRQQVKSTWDLLLPIWDLDDRPEIMQHEATVNTMSLESAFAYKLHYENQAKKEGKGDGVFGKDTDIPVKKYAAAEDNCADKLHPAR